MSPGLETLLDRVRQGDQQALSPLVTCEDAFIVAQVRRFFDHALRSVVETEDLEQDVRVRVLRALPHADFSSAEAFRAWIVHVVRSVAIDVHRHFFKTRKRPRITSLDDTATFDDAGQNLANGIPAEQRTPSSVMRQQEAESRLAAVLLKLQPKHREILRLVLFEQQRPIDIAARMGRNAATVRKELARAVQACAVILGRERSGP